MASLAESPSSVNKTELSPSFYIKILKDKLQMRLDSTIDSKSSNNTYLNIIEILSPCERSE